MALTAVAKERLKALKIDVAALEAAVKADTEVEVALPEGSLLTDAELSTRDTVKMKEGQKEGEKQAITIAKTELTKAGITVTKERWGDVAEEIKVAINATADVKLKTLQDQNTALLADKETLTAEATAAKNQLTTGLFELEVMQSLPVNPTGLKPAETLSIMKMRGYNPERTDAGIIWKKGADPIKDPATHAPLAADKAVEAIFKENNWITQAGGGPGRGGGNSGSGGGNSGVKTMSALQEQWKAEHPEGNVMSPEFTNHAAKVMSENADFNAYA